MFEYMYCALLSDLLRATLSGEVPIPKSKYISKDYARIKAGSSLLLMMLRSLMTRVSCLMGLMMICIVGLMMMGLSIMNLLMSLMKVPYIPFPVIKSFIRNTLNLLDAHLKLSFPFSTRRFDSMLTFPKQQ